MVGDNFPCRSSRLVITDGIRIPTLLDNDVSGLLERSIAVVDVLGTTLSFRGKCRLQVRA